MVVNSLVILINTKILMLNKDRQVIKIAGTCFHTLAHTFTLTFLQGFLNFLLTDFSMY